MDFPSIAIGVNNKSRLSVMIQTGILGERGG